MASSRKMPFFFWQNQWRQYILTKAEVAFSGFLRSSPAQFFSPCQEYIYISKYFNEGEWKKNYKMISTAVITVAFTFLFTIQIQENCQKKKKTKKRQVT